MNQDILNHAIGTAFAIIQAILLAVVFAGGKALFDIHGLKKDMNAAFTKIRELECKKNKES